MLDLITKLSKYGQLAIKRDGNTWYVACMLTLGGTIEGKAYAEDYNLYHALLRLYEETKIENNKMWAKQKAPKQLDLSYGLDNTSGYKENLKQDS